MKFQDKFSGQQIFFYLKTAGFGAFGTGNTSGGLFGSTSTAGTSLFSGAQNAFGGANKSVFGASTNPSGQYSYCSIAAYALKY